MAAYLTDDNGYLAKKASLAEEARALTCSALGQPANSADLPPDRLYMTVMALPRKPGRR